MATIVLLVCGLSLIVIAFLVIRSPGTISPQAASIYPTAAPATITPPVAPACLGTWGLNKPVVRVGRASDNDVCLANFPNGDTVSPYHARLVFEEGYWLLLDGGDDRQPSLNGVYVDGRRGQRVRLYPGSQIGFGLVQLPFSLQLINFSAR